MPGLGSVIQLDGKGEQYVVVGYKNKETYGSCSYDEYWTLMPLSRIKTAEYIYEGEGTEVHVTGVKRTPDIVEVTNEAPFELIKEVRYHIRRKTPKQITIYE